MIKNLIYSLFIPLIFISCFSDTTTLSLNTQELNFEGSIKGEVQVVTLSGNASWDIEQPIVDWFTITPLSGDGTAEIRVTTNSINESETARVEEVRIAVQDAPNSSLKISQSGSTAEGLTDGMLEKTTVGFYSQGEDVFVLDRDLSQQGFNSISISWRIVSDDQTKIVSAILNKIPVVGEIVNINLQTKGITPKLEQKLTCKVYKKQESRFWIYDINERKGFIIDID